jgi:hypothetical protein
MSVKKLSPDDLKMIGIVAGAGVLLYFVVKFGKGITSGLGKGLDIIGAGPASMAAESKVEKVNELPSSKNPFDVRYLDGLKPGYKILTGAGVTNLYNDITGKLSLWQTYKHPFSFEKDRMAVFAMIKKHLKTKSQVAYLSKYFQDKGNDLFKTLDKGFRDTGWTTSDKYQKMFTEIVNHILNLPAQ